RPGPATAATTRRGSLVVDLAPGLVYRPAAFGTDARRRGATPGAVLLLPAPSNELCRSSRYVTPASGPLSLYRPARRRVCLRRPRQAGAGREPASAATSLQHVA